MKSIIKSIFKSIFEALVVAAFGFFMAWSLVYGLDKEAELNKQQNVKWAKEYK